MRYLSGCPAHDPFQIQRAGPGIDAYCVQRHASVRQVRGEAALQWGSWLFFQIIGEELQDLLRIVYHVIGRDQ